MTDLTEYPQRRPLSANEWAEKMREIEDKLSTAEDIIRDSRRAIELMLMQFVINPEGETKSVPDETEVEKLRAVVEFAARMKKGEWVKVSLAARAALASPPKG